MWRAMTQVASAPLAAVARASALAMFSPAVATARFAQAAGKNKQQMAAALGLWSRTLSHPLPPPTASTHINAQFRQFHTDKANNNSSSTNNNIHSNDFSQKGDSTFSSSSSNSSFTQQDDKNRTGGGGEDDKNKKSKGFGYALLVGGISLGVMYYIWAGRTGKAMKRVHKLLRTADTAEKNGDYAASEDALRQALALLEGEHQDQARLHVKDLLANVLVHQKRYAEALDLFKEVAQGFVNHGFSTSDPAFIEVSIKMANLLNKLGFPDGAESGYRWCISTLANELKPVCEQIPDSTTLSRDAFENYTSLYGMSLDALAELLTATNGNQQEVFSLLQKSLSAAESLGPKHRTQTALCANKLSLAYANAGQLKEAEVYALRSVKISSELNEAHVYVYLTNLGVIKSRMGKMEESRQCFQQALELATKKNDQAAAQRIKQYMPEIKQTSFTLMGRNRSAGLSADVIASSR